MHWGEAATGEAGARHPGGTGKTMTGKTSKADVAYSWLRERIIEGVYGPGYRVVIDQLVRETGISSIPWREAIRRLEAEGWIQVVPQVGARIATFEPNAYAQTMQVLARLEGYATALALPNVTPHTVQAAAEVNQNMARALEDFDPVRFTRLNREFHFILYEHCGDAHLHSLITSEWGRLDVIGRSSLALVPGRARASVAEHEALLNLLSDSRNFDAVEAAARQHKLNSLQAAYVHEASAGSVAAQDQTA
jgi:DNA-binding GntR family transcriptional regulator